MKEKKKLWMALGAGLLALFATATYLEQREGALLKITSAKSVIRAKKDIVAGTMIDASMVTQTTVPAQFLEPQAQASLEEVMGQVTALPISQGEQVLATKLIPQGGVGSLPIRISQGMRAVALSCDEACSGSGLIRPNDFVDVLSTFDVTDSTDKTQSMTLTVAQNILVLAVGSDAGSAKKQKTAMSGGLFSDTVQGMAQKTVTLAVAPQQAQELVFSGQNGDLHLLLRSRWNEENQEMKPTASANLLGVRGVVQKGNYREYKGR